MRYLIPVLVAGWLVYGVNLMASSTHGIRERNTAETVPVDYENTGAQPEYVHGTHCIDGRTF